MATHDEHDSSNPGSSHSSQRPNDSVAGPPAALNPEAGLEHEVGDLEDPDAVEEDGALPGRMGGGLAGG